MRFVDLHNNAVSTVRQFLPLLRLSGNYYFHGTVPPFVISRRTTPCPYGDRRRKILQKKHIQEVLESRSRD